MTTKITQGVIDTDAVGPAQIQADAIAASEIATDAVGTAEIAPMRSVLRRSLQTP